MLLKWKRSGEHLYESVGQEATYQIERMRDDDTRRIVWVVTVDYSTPEAFHSLQLAKASAQDFEHGYTRIT